MSHGRQFIQRTAGLLVVAFLHGALLTPPGSSDQLYYATGAIPIVLITAYVLVDRTDGEGFARFLAVAGVGSVVIYFVGVVLSPTGIGIGTGWVALAAAFFAAYAIVYTDERSIRGSTME